MNRFKTIFTALLLAFATNAFAGDSITESLKLNLMNTPSKNGDKTYSYIRWLYDDTYSSSIYFTYEKRTTDSKLAGLDESLLLSKTTDVIADFFPIELRGNPAEGITMRGGLGLNITYNKLEEQGYFNNGANQIFKNRSESTFYTVKLQGEFTFNLLNGNFTINDRVECIPVYYLMSSQKMSILPLATNSPVSNDYEGISFPYAMNDLKFYIFRLFEIQYTVEYQRLNYEQIDLNDTADALVVKDENKYTIFNQTIMINLRPDIFKDLDLVLGFGKKYFSTKNNTTGEDPVKSNEWVYNIGVTSKI